MKKYNKVSVKCTVASEPKVIRCKERLIVTFDIEISRTHNSLQGEKTAVASMPAEMNINVKNKDLIKTLLKGTEISAKGYFKPEEIKSENLSKIVLEIVSIDIVNNL